MTEKNKDEIRRIEITDTDSLQKTVSVDFHFGSVLVNFDFKQSDLPMLSELLAQLKREFKDLEAL